MPGFLGSRLRFHSCLLLYSQSIPLIIRPRSHQAHSVTMSNGIPLFCTAEEAKPLVSKSINIVVNELDGAHPFAIVKSRQPPPKDEEFAMQTEADGSFETEWVGASVDECRTWALQEDIQSRKSIEKKMIAIMDHRSAENETVLMEYHQRGPGLPFRETGEDAPEEGGPPYRDGEILPEKPDTWYSFRVKPKHIDQVVADLSGITSPDVVYPYYFRRKDEFTTEDGIFDLDKKEETLKKEIEEGMG